MHWANQLTKLQVDMTSYCNARCPACARNQCGGDVTPGLELKHLDVDVWNKLCTDVHDIQKLTLNGNWGDPLMHPNVLEMLETFIEHNPQTAISVNTNGGMRKPDWWAKLAKTLNKAYAHEVRFAIDGLENTHEMYRRGVDFFALCDNTKAYANAGGHAIWLMTLWDHNIEQVATARGLATMLGVQTFDTRYSHSPEQVNVNNEYWLYNREAKKVELENTHLYSNYFANHRKIQDKTDNCSQCPWYNDGRVQIDPWAKVWPCCNISIFTVEQEEFGPDLFDMSQVPADFNDLTQYSIYEILEHEWYNTTLSGAIDNAEHGICRQVCGVHK